MSKVNKMSRNLDWRGYIDEVGDFELAKYLYDSIVSLMKHSLDLGTLLSDDDSRLRAYREQIKSTFKGRWMEMAQALEYFDIIVPCICKDEFCTLCGGARYRLNNNLSPDEMQEIAVVVKDGANNTKLQRMLEEGLEKALEEVGRRQREV